MGKNAEKIIEEYWIKHVKRNHVESKSYCKHDWINHTLLIKEELEKMGATDLMIICANVEAPKLTFILNEKKYTTDCLYDFNFDKVMNHIKILIL